MDASGFHLDLFLMQAFMSGASAAIAFRFVDDLKQVVAARRRAVERKIEG
jgi:hypothetical protein